MGSEKWGGSLIMDVVTMAVLEDMVDTTVASILPGFVAKDSVATTSDLPVSGNSKGDLRVVEADGSQWYWNGSSWIQLNQTATNAQIDGLYS